MKFRQYARFAVSSGVRLLRFWFGYRSRLVNSLLEPGRSFGRDGLDSRVMGIIGLRRGYYVEVGANDGVTQSNTLLFENSGGWRGLLIEPIPEIYKELRHNRSSARNFILNGALVSSDFDGDSLQLYSAGQMSLPVIPTVDVKNPLAHAEEGLRVQSKISDMELSTVAVSAITLNEALRRAKAPKVIDFFSLDVEGWEIEVLKGVNFASWDFRWVLVETRSLEDLKVFMLTRGFTFHSQVSPRDALFFRAGAEN